MGIPRKALTGKATVGGAPKKPSIPAAKSIKPNVKSHGKAGTGN